MAFYSSIAASLGLSGFAAALFVGAARIATAIALNRLVVRLSQQDGPSFEAQGLGVQNQLRRGADVPMSFVMGKTATAGSLIYANTFTTGSVPNGTLTMVIALSDLPVRSLDGIWVNGERCTLSAQPESLFGRGVLEVRGESDEFTDLPRIFVEFRDGTNNSPLPQQWLDLMSTTERPFDATAVGEGVAWVAVTVYYDQEVFSGFPEFLFELSGVPLYDPSRDDTAGGTGAQRWDDPSTWGGDGDDLPAVQLFNIYRGITYDGAWFYGFQGVDAGQLPAADWISAIEACRAPIDANSGAEPTYRAGLEVLVSNTVAETVQALLDACHGRIVESGGVFKPQIGAPDAVVMSITDDDLLATDEQRLNPFFGLAETVNGIAARFPDPAQGWQLEGAPPLIDETLEVEDGGFRLQVNMDFPACPYDEQVQRLMQSALNEARRARQHTLRLPPRFWALEALDIISWTSQSHGYDGKLFRVDGAQDLPDCSVLVDLTEVEPGDWGFVTETDFTPLVRGSVVVPPVTAQPVVSWAVEPWSVVDAAGTGRAPALRVRWDGTAEDVEAVRYQLRLQAGAVVVGEGRFDEVSAGAGIIEAGVLPGQTYEVRGRYISGNKRRTSWTGWLTVTAPDLRPALADLDASVGAAIDLASQSAETDKLAAEAASAAAQLASLGAQSAETETLRISALTVGAGGRLASHNLIPSLDEVDPITGIGWTKYGGAPGVPAGASKGINLRTGARAMPMHTDLVPGRVLRIWGWISTLPTFDAYRLVLRGGATETDALIETLHTFPAQQGWQQFDITVTTTQSAAFWALGTDVPNANNSAHFADLVMEDITESQAAAGSAAAAVVSAQTASANETKTDADAAAAEAQRVLAETARSGAEASEVAAAAALLQADQAAATAQQSADVAARLRGHGLTNDPGFQSVALGTTGNHWDSNPGGGFINLQSNSNSRYDGHIELLIQPSTVAPYPSFAFRGDRPNVIEQDAAGAEVVEVSLELEVVQASDDWTGAALEVTWAGATPASVTVPLDTGGLRGKAGLIQSVDFIIERPAGWQGSSGTDLFRVALISATDDTPVADAAKLIRLHFFEVRNLTAYASARIFQEAKVSLDGLQSSALVLRAAAGGGEAQLELVSAADPINGAASALRMSADNLLLEGSTRLVHTDRGGDVSGNLIANGSLSSADARGWAAFPAAVSIVEQDTTGTQSQVRQGIPASHALLFSADAVAQRIVQRDTVPVAPEQTLFFSCDVARGGSGAAPLVRFVVEFYAPSGAYQYATESSWVTLSVSGWQRIETVITVPGNIGYCKFSFQVAGNASARNVLATNFSAFKQVSGNALLVEGGMRADRLESDTITSDQIDAGQIGGDELRIDELIELLPGGAFVRGKQSFNDDEADGLYIGNIGTDAAPELGINMGLTRTVGYDTIRQSLKISESGGLVIHNAKFTADRQSQVFASTDVTASTSNIALTGTTLKFEMIGGGASGARNNAGNGLDSGGDTVVTLRDGSTTVATWVAAGATTIRPGGSKKGQGSHYGPGGGKDTDKTPGDLPNAPASSYGAGGGSNAFKSGASGGAAGERREVVDIDISGLSNPRLDVVIGPGGNGFEDFDFGSDNEQSLTYGGGAPGFVRYYTANAADNEISITDYSLEPIGWGEATVTTNSGDGATYSGYFNDGVGFPVAGQYRVWFEEQNADIDERVEFENGQELTDANGTVNVAAGERGRIYVVGNAHGARTTTVRWSFYKKLTT